MAGLKFKDKIFIRQMTKRAIGWKTWAAIIAVVVAVFYLGGPADILYRYIHFQTLTKETLRIGAQKYVRENAQDQGQRVCLYVVSCDGGAASLERVDNVDQLDLVRLKQTIWKRRSSAYCPGRTTNIGLQLIPEDGHKTEPENVALARWSFFNDRFIPQMSRFESGSFSTVPWTPCSQEASWDLNRPTFSKH